MSNEYTSLSVIIGTITIMKLDEVSESCDVVIKSRWKEK